MPGVLRVVNVTKLPTRIETFMVQNESFMLVNPDITNPIFIGNDPGSQTISIPPLGSIALNGTDHDTWLSTAGANYTVNAYLLPNGTYWTPSPAQVAAQISALGLATASNQNTAIANQASQATAANQATAIANQGTMNNSINAGPNSTAALIATGNAGGTPGGVPLLRYTNGLGSGNAQTLAGGASVALVNNVPVTQPGYEMSISAYIPAGAGTIPFAQLVLSWIDNATGQVIRTAPYVISLGNGVANTIPNYINGPCYGNKVSMQLTNLDPAQTMTFTWVLNQTSHVHLTDNIIQPSYPAGNAPITFSWPGGTPALGVLCMSKPSVPPSSYLYRLLAAYNGKVQITVDNIAGLNTCQVGVVDPTGNLYTNIGSQGGFATTVPVAGSFTTEIALPRGPMLLRLGNPTATNTIAPTVLIICKDY